LSGLRHWSESASSCELSAENRSNRAQSPTFREPENCAGNCVSIPRLRVTCATLVSSCGGRTSSGRIPSQVHPTHPGIPIGPCELHSLPRASPADAGRVLTSMGIPTTCSDSGRVARTWTPRTLTPGIEPGARP